MLRIDLGPDLIAELFFTLLLSIVLGTMPMLLGCPLLDNPVPYRQAATLAEP
jgi:hypothetical protein